MLQDELNLIHGPRRMRDADESIGTYQRHFNANCMRVHLKPEKFGNMTWQVVYYRIH